MKTSKNIEDFTKYIITEVSSEKPSSNFVDKVMDTIKTENSITSIKAQHPLISKRGWVIVSLLIVGVFILVLTGNFENPEFVSKIQGTISSKLNAFNLFEGIRISKLFTFSFVFFSALVVLQIVFIKNYFNRQNAI
jgi:hypothetical protein